MASSSLDSVEVGQTFTFTKTVGETINSLDKERGRSTARVDVFNHEKELVAVAEHITRWAKMLSSAGKAI